MKTRKVISRKTALGVSLDGAMARCVLMRRSPQGIHILKTLSLDLDSQDGIGLAKRLSREGVLRYPIYLVVPRHVAVVRYLFMPPLAGDDLSGAVQYEASKHFPFDLKGVHWDFDVAGKDPSAVSVVVAAVGTDILRGVMQSVEGANTGLFGVGISSFALHGCYQWLRSRQSWGLSMLVDCSSSGLSIVVCDEEALLWCRGIARPVGQKSDGTGWVADEVVRSIDAYVRESGGRALERVLLSGETRDMEAVHREVQAELALPVSLVNPFVQAISVSHSDVSEAQAFVAATGAGLAGLGVAGLSINLMPKPEPISLRSLASKENLERAAYLMLTCIVLSVFSLIWQTTLKEKRLLHVANEIHAKEIAGQETEALIGEVRELTKQVDRVRSCDEAWTSWIDLLKELYSQVPVDDVTIEKIELSDGRLDELACTGKSATELIGRLEGSLFFQDVTTKGAITADPKQQGMERFTLVANVSRKGR